MSSVKLRGRLHLEVIVKIAPNDAEALPNEVKAALAADAEPWFGLAARSRLSCVLLQMSTLP